MAKASNKMNPPNPNAKLIQALFVSLDHIIGDGIIPKMNAIVNIVNIVIPMIQLDHFDLQNTYSLSTSFFLFLIHNHDTVRNIGGSKFNTTVVWVMVVKNVEDPSPIFPVVVIPTSNKIMLTNIPCTIKPLVGIFLLFCFSTNFPNIPFGLSEKSTFTGATVQNNNEPSIFRKNIRPTKRINILYPIDDSGRWNNAGKILK